MTIRAATLDDLPQLHEMAAHFLRETPYGDVLRAPSEAHLFGLVEQVLSLGIILVAELHDQLVGMIALVALTHPFSGELFGDELVWWVEPTQRGTGVGPHLLDMAEAWARSKGLAFLKMVAPAGSDIGTFYVRMGYRAIETAYSKPLATTVTFRRSMSMATDPKTPEPKQPTPPPMPPPSTPLPTPHPPGTTAPVSEDEG